MKINLDDVVSLIKSNDNFLIISHDNPDCDTLGSAFALHYSLCKLNKKSKIICASPFPQKYAYYISEANFDDFTPGFIITVDVADIKLLGSYTEEYRNKIDLCIDHHVSNTLFAKKTYLDEKASSTCEAIYDILKSLDVCVDSLIAKCIYSGIATDTGCFRYSNVTSKTHFIASELLKFDFESLDVCVDSLIAKCIYSGIATDTGCFRYSNVTSKTHFIASELLKFDFDSYQINYDLFECKKREVLQLEYTCIQSIEYYFNAQCAIMVIPNDLIEKSNLEPTDIEDISSIPRRIKGVKVGITIKFKDVDQYKISVRTNSDIDASKICSEFGGGGHKAAAGCLIKDSLDNVKSRLIDTIKRYLVD